MKKKKRNNKKNISKFSRDIQEMKLDFKKMIDTMSDDEFLDFIAYISSCTSPMPDYDEDFYDDEGWEDEAAEFYGEDYSNIIEDDSLPF